MRLTLSLAIFALAAATPAAAQNEVSDPAAPVEVNTVDSNAAAPTPADPTAGQPVDAAPMPAETDVAAETDVVIEDEAAGGERNFPWGLVGLVGLVGLLGRRRSS